MGRKYLQPPPEQARSYEEFCPPAAREQYLCQTSSYSGWNLIAILSEGPVGLAGIFFFISLTDPEPAWWQWFGAFVSTALALWIFSFPMRTAARDTPRNQELGEMWDIWHGWLHRGEAPRWTAEIDDFTGPDRSPSPTWRLCPDGDESAVARPRPPERASTDEQYRCRIAYEQALCLSRPWLGPRGGNFAAWIVAIVAVILTVVFAGALTQPGPSAQDWARVLGFGALTLVALSFPVRAFRHDIPRYRQLRRMRRQWEAEQGGYTRPPAPPPPGQQPFDASPSTGTTGAT